ncbi:HD domain-containing phosphohydrolase [Hippea alviniae]|uniref:HD domain-containing phosphohydrolase n=1 Tax=Hippea alviniae TaxID=1279027 RepID=UPI0003B31371|nr:HD domain-containing phosphohydrolase [Hippea alviniae]
MGIKEKFKNVKVSMISVLLTASLLITALSVFVVGYFWHKTALECYHENVKHITSIYLENAKEYSKYMVDNIIKEIEEDINYTYGKIKKEKQAEFYKTVRKLYALKSEGRDKFLLFARRYLALETFNSDITYYIFDLKGRCLFNPFDKLLEGRNLIGLEDKKSNKPFLKLVNLAKSHDTGCLFQNYPYNWHFLKKEDIGRYGFTFFVVFRNYGYIVVGRFDLEPIEYSLHQKWVKYLSIYRYGKNNHGYIFVLKLRKHPSNGCFAYEIVNPNRPKAESRCLSLLKKDKEGFLYREKYFKDIETKGYSFVEYYYRLPGSDRDVLKVSYLKLFKRWNWVIGTGTYMPDLYSSLRLAQIRDKRELNRVKTTMALVFSVVSFLILALYLYVSRFANRKINTVFRKFEDYLSRAEFIDTRPYRRIKQLMWITGSLNKAIEKFKKYENDLLKSFVDVLETRDIYTKGHSQRVAFYSKKIAEALGFDEKFQEKIYKAGLLHDIGKVGIPDNILLKPGRLSENEYKTIKYHSVISYEILKRVEHFKDIAECVRQHHEKCDGSGYPDGLKCDEICIEARILAIADIFDALTTTRPYRKAFTPEEAIEILKKEKVDQDILSKVEKVLLDAFKERELTTAEFMSEEIDRIRSEIFKVDYMTGLLFITSFVGELRSLIKNNRRFVLFAINIKGIAEVNYRFSTETGNRVIENMAKIIKDAEKLFKGEMFACRAYADIFLVAVKLDKFSLEEIESFFNGINLARLLKESFMDDTKCREKTKKGVCISEYIGVVVDRVVYPEDGETAEELIYFVEKKIKRK